MYPATYFPNRRTVTGSGGGSSGIGEGTGLNPEQSALLQDLQTWRDTRPGLDGLSLLEILQEVNLGAGYGVDYHNWRNHENPDEQPVNRGIFLLLLDDKADKNQLDTVQSTLNAAVTRIQPSTELVPPANASSFLYPSNQRLTPNRTYLCYPTVGYSGLSEAILYLNYPVDSNSFEVRIVNLSPNGTPLRIQGGANMGQNATRPFFRRGNNIGSDFSLAQLTPGRAMRLVFYPAAFGVFQRNGVNTAGYIEYDEEGDESRTLTPIYNYA